MRLGTIGSGWITDEFIHGALDSGLWTLNGVYSRDRLRAEAYAKKHGAARSFVDLNEMATSPEIDAVYIASPNALHFDHCMTFLSHGKHVLCEKPLCAQASQVAKLYRTAEQNNVVFLEAIMYMHLPQRKILERALSQIGDIFMVKLDFCQRSSKLDAYLTGELPNIFNPMLETGALMDLGVYCIYPALHLFGLPKRFNICANLLDSGADAAGAITMEDEHRLITITYSKVGQAKAGSEFQGVNGTIYVDSISRLADIELIKPDGSTEVLFGSEEKYKLMGYEAIDFHRYITDKEESQTEYERCKQLSLEVSKFMEEARAKAGIHFSSDN